MKLLRCFFALILFVAVGQKTIAQDFTPPSVKIDENDRKLGTILFSKKPIIGGKERKDQITTSFADGDQVFAMAYLPGSLEDLNFDKGYILFVREDGDPNGFSWRYQVESLSFKPKGKLDGTQTFYDLDIFVGLKDAWRKEMTSDFLKMFANHIEQKGKKANHVYTFTVEFLSEYTTRAVGEFTLDLSKGTGGMKALHESHEKAALVDTRLPASKRNDPALADKIKKVMIAKGTDVHKVIFTANDWSIVRNSLSGRITGRNISAYIVAKEPDGKCVYNEMFFKQEYIGSSFSDKVIWTGTGLAGGYILCENVK